MGQQRQRAHFMNAWRRLLLAQRATPPMAKNAEQPNSRNPTNRINDDACGRQKIRFSVFLLVCDVGARNSATPGGSTSRCVQQVSEPPQSSRSHDQNFFVAHSSPTALLVSHIPERRAHRSWLHRRQTLLKCSTSAKKRREQGGGQLQSLSRRKMATTLFRPGDGPRGSC